MKREALRHPKTLDLMARLGINRREAVGLLDLLIDWAIDYAPRGDIGKWSNGVIAGAVDWNGDADDLVEHLVGAGWIDRNSEYRLIIHDWPLHTPQFLRAKLKKLGLSFLPCYSVAEPSTEPDNNPVEASKVSNGESVEPTIPPLSSPPLPSPPAAAAAATRKAAAAAVVDSAEWEQAKPLGNRIRDVLHPDKARWPKPDEWRWMAKVAVLGIRYGPEWYEPAFEALKNGKPQSRLAVFKHVLDDECQRRNTRLNRELSKVDIPESYLPRTDTAKRATLVSEVQSC